MQPLKARTSSSSPIESLAIELLRSAGRHQPPLGQKQRVRIRLLERSVPPMMLVPWPAIVVVLLIVTAGASAALATGWLRHRHASQPSVTSQASGVLAVAAARSQRAASVELASAMPDAGAPVAARSSTEATQALDARGAEHHESAPRASQTTEKSLVFDAMRALRREGHPERAAKLLDEYMRRYSSGSLAEEALALAIEASTALSDPRAKSLAEKYLARYPQGRFRSAAERARSRFGQ